MSYDSYTVKIRPCKFKPGDMVRLNCSDDINHHKRGRVQAIKFDDYKWENVPVVQMINDFVAEDLFSESEYLKTYTIVDWLTEDWWELCPSSFVGINSLL